MNLKAVVKGGLINGLAVGLSLHWMIFARVYETVYEFKWPNIVSGVANILAVIILSVALLSIGPHAILLSKGNVKTKKQGVIVGAGAGVIVGLMVYLAGAPGTTLAGMVPLFIYFLEPARLDGIEPYAVFERVVTEAIAATYLFIVAPLLVGALIGGMEGLVFMLIRSWWPGRRTESTAQSEAGTDDRIAA